MGNKKILMEVGVGEVFKVAGIEFVKFYDENGQTVAVAKDSLFTDVFGANNNFAASNILKRLNEEVLPKVVAEVGEENVVEHEVDLLSLDGSDKWGKVNCKISIPTFDFYRKHVKVFDKHKPSSWWWLATPDTTTDHYDCDYWVSCVAPSGCMDLNIGGCNYFGVRPFCVLKSNIFVSK